MTCIGRFPPCQKPRRVRAAHRREKSDVVFPAACTSEKHFARSERRRDRLRSRGAERSESPLAEKASAFFARFVGVGHGLQHVHPHRAHLPQFPDHPGHLLQDVVHFLHGVVLAQAQAQRAVGDLMGHSQGQQHVAGVQAAAGAGAAGAGADAGHVQAQQQALPLDALKAEADDAGDLVVRVAVAAGAGDPAQALDELVPHGRHLFGVLLQVLAALLQRRRHG